MIRCVLPQLTEERRKDYIKLARHKGEDAKVSIRNIRRKAKDELDKLVKDGDVGEDDGNRGEKELDATTKKYVDTDRRAAEGQGDRAARGLSRSHDHDRMNHADTARPARRRAPRTAPDEDPTRRDADAAPRATAATRRRPSKAGRNLPAAIGVGRAAGRPHHRLPGPAQGADARHRRRRDRRRRLGAAPGARDPGSIDVPLVPQPASAASACWCRPTSRGGEALS